MKKNWFLLLLLSLGITDSMAQTFEYELSSGSNYELASFRFWIPESTEELNALLVLVPGYNWDGRNAISDSSWQVFARKHKLALAACYFRDYKDTEVFYREASKGSGNALLQAIQKCARESGHSSLDRLPLILYGQSAGGQFNYEFACWKPDRVLSFVVNKGGYYHTAIAPADCRKIPAIFFMGENDLYYRNDLIKGIFSVNRKLDAHWVLISEYNSGHQFEASPSIARSFFESILSPELSEKDYYLGNWESKTIRSATEEASKDSLYVWLPGKAFAETWEEVHRR